MKKLINAIKNFERRNKIQQFMKRKNIDIFLYLIIWIATLLILSFLI